MVSGADVRSNESDLTGEPDELEKVVLNEDNY